MPVAVLGWDLRRVRFAQGGAEYAFGVPSMLGFSFLVGVIGTAGAGAALRLAGLAL